MINTQAVQVSAPPGDPHLTHDTAPLQNSIPSAGPGKHLTFISNSLKLLLKIIEKLRPSFAYYLVIYIVHLFMIGFKYEHFLEGT